jgi:hypothetical protein
MCSGGLAWRQFLLPVVAILTFVAAAAVIFATGGPPQLDQAGPVGYVLNFHSYPTFDDEVVPQLLGAFLHIVGPRDPAAANTLLRLVSAALYLASAALLSTAMLRTEVGRGALMLLLFASGFPFLWLSSELIAGALLCFAVWLVATERHPLLIGVCLGALALTKSELVLAAGTIAAIYLFRRRTATAGLAVGFAALVGVLVAPGLASHGAAFFTNRSWSAFGQHYAALVANLQLGPRPDPWTSWQSYTAAAFPGATSVVQVIHHHPVVYTFYVALSAAFGLWNAWTAFGLALVAIAVRMALRSTGPRPVEGWLLAAMVVLVPQLLISFPHVRYMARLAPLVLMVPLAEIESRRDRWAVLMSLLMGGYFVLTLSDRLTHLSSFGWFPD